MSDHKNNNACVGAYLNSASTQHGNLLQLSTTLSRVTYLFCRLTQEPVLATATHEKLLRDLGQMQVKGPEG